MNDWIPAAETVAFVWFVSALNSFSVCSSPGDKCVDCGEGGAEFCLRVEVLICGLTAGSTLLSRSDASIAAFKSASSSLLTGLGVGVGFGRGVDVRSEASIARCSSSSSFAREFVVVVPDLGAERVFWEEFVVSRV